MTTALAHYKMKKAFFFAEKKAFFNKTCFRRSTLQPDGYWLAALPIGSNETAT